MEIRQAEFLLSATKLEECPQTNLPEVCFAGRSNVGKSSLINYLTNRKKLARTSNTPGKTQQFNYYVINSGEFHLVDLPGYGYAKVSMKERALWGRQIQRYLMERQNIKMIFQLVDCRHEPTEKDEEFMYWLAEHQRPFSVILTKMDKLSKNKQQQSLARLKRIHKEMNIEVPIIISSSETRTGREEILRLIEEFIYI